jgi:hypothetical protein
MILPTVHRTLQRGDLARLVAEIARGAPNAAGPAVEALEAGDVDALLDQSAALDAVRGFGGAPAPLPLTLLWYVPVRAALRRIGEQAVDLADYGASVPLAFIRIQSTHLASRGEMGLEAWNRAIAALPADTTVRAERAADCAALALWWVGCFPQRVTRHGGRGMVRAYLRFAAGALTEAAGQMGDRAPQVSDLFNRAASRIEALHEALVATSMDYLGPEAHSARGRLERYLSRLGN